MKNLNQYEFHIKFKFTPRVQVHFIEVCNMGSLVERKRLFRDKTYFLILCDDHRQVYGLPPRKSTFLHARRINEDLC